jgi:hypothetical protein
MVPKLPTGSILIIEKMIIFRVVNSFRPWWGLNIGLWLQKWIFYLKTITSQLVAHYLFDVCSKLIIIICEKHQT